MSLNQYSSSLSSGSGYYRNSKNKNNEIINLTTLEYKILNLLIENINKVVTRDRIIDSIWEWTGNDVDSHTITVYFQRIRQKLGTDIISTVKGLGYRIDYEK